MSKIVSSFVTECSRVRSTCGECHAAKNNNVCVRSGRSLGQCSLVASLHWTAAAIAPRAQRRERAPPSARRPLSIPPFNS